MDSWRSAVRKGLALSLMAMLAIGILSGCQQQTFLAREVFEDAHAPLKKLEKDYCGIKEPVTPLTAAPPTIDNADRPPRYLTLMEAFAIALENGHASSRTGGGRADDTMAAGSIGGGVLTTNQTERIRVLALYPAISHAAMEAQIGRFDPLFVSTIFWANTDNLQQGLASFQNGQSATAAMGFLKPMPTGGLATMMLLSNYQNLNVPPTGAFSVLNPQYTNRLVLGFEQPLWKDWGVELNRLLPRFPGISGQSINPGASSAALSAFNNRQGLLGSFVDRQGEGILISRLRFDAQRVEFERVVNHLILHTEEAYWNLRSKYGKLDGTNKYLEVLHDTWVEAKNQHDLGKTDPEVFNRVEGEYFQAKHDRVIALTEVLLAEKDLRGILGLTVEDGVRLIPITEPTMSEFKPDWGMSLRDALHLRPELELARNSLRFHQYLLGIQKNFLRPDLRAFIRYEPLGFGSTLTGSGEFLDGTNTARTTNAFRSLAGGHFVDYTLGVNFSMPLGWRYELAAVRAARLELTQAYLFLRDQEEKAARNLHTEFINLGSSYDRIRWSRGERVAFGKEVDIRLKKIKLGKDSLNTPSGSFLLDAMRRWRLANEKEYAAIAEYNTTLAKLEFSKGTILRYNNIHINEGALPTIAQVRAVEYEKERSRSLVLRERPDSLHQPHKVCAMKPGEAIKPFLRERDFPPLPTKIEPPKKLDVLPATVEKPKVPEVTLPPLPTELPPPRKLGLLQRGLDAVRRKPAAKGDVIAVEFRAKQPPAPASLPMLEETPPLPSAPAPSATSAEPPLAVLPEPGPAPPPNFPRQR